MCTLAKTLTSSYCFPIPRLTIPKKASTMALNLNVPSSDSIVTVRMLDSTSYGKVPANMMFQPSVPGHEVASFPCLVFLITNNRTNEHVLYDLGIRKDWRTGYPPNMYNMIGDNSFFKISVDKDIRDILDADPGNLKITTSTISACIWSHVHFDHRGDMSLFPSSTKLVIGPDTRNTYPTYPTKPDSDLHEDEFSGRDVHELSSSDLTLTIGNYPAHDLLKDGSFYLLSSPGHTAGHLCALARVSTSPSTFIFLGGDCTHHCAQFRPSQHVPLPISVSLNTSTMEFSKDLTPGPPYRRQREPIICPGSLIATTLHPSKADNQPFYDLLQEPINHSYDEACISRDKMQVFDADENVLVIMAHDRSVMDALPFYPETLNGWKEAGLKQKVKWEFLQDFDLSSARAEGRG